jgi:hypothetical protein
MYISHPMRNPQIFFCKAQATFPGFCHNGGQKPKIPQILAYRLLDAKKCSKITKKSKLLPPIL